MVESWDGRKLFVWVLLKPLRKHAFLPPELAPYRHMCNLNYADATAPVPWETK